MTSDGSKKLDILVSGAGIAGLTTAHFLLRAGHKITLVERASALRASGQNVDVRGHGLSVIQRMKNEKFDVESIIRAKSTKEKGLKFVDKKNESWADFPVDDGSTFTGEIEIMRGDLAIVLYDSIKDMPGLEIVFDRKVTSLAEAADGINVELDKEWPNMTSQRKFDLVIAADGIASGVRSLAFPKSTDAVSSLKQWCCWFSIPWRSSDGSWARWYNASKGRMVLIRPDNEKVTRASLWTMARDPAFQKAVQNVRRSSTIQQKEFWFDHFQNAGWESDRIVLAMREADDFYMQEIGQVKMQTYHEGRVVLVGDAGYCPSPISGMGTTTALVGAYVLAGEIVRLIGDQQTALHEYQTKMQPFVNVAQQLAPGTPGAANPETDWGIWALHCFLAFVSWSKLYKLFTASVNPPSQAMKLPVYQFD